MATIPFSTLEDADTRSREWWVHVLQRAKYPDDITEYLYSRQVNEETGDVAVVVPERDTLLDELIRADQMTANELAALVNLYESWSADGVQYQAGDLRAHNGTLYKCVQPHTSQSDWQPDVVPALWTHAAPAGVLPAWIAPTGAHDAYALGARVTHNGQVWESTVNNNVWEPGVFGWIVVEG